MMRRIIVVGAVVTALTVSVCQGLAGAAASVSDPVFSGTVTTTTSPTNGDVTSMVLHGNLLDPKTGLVIGNLNLTESTYITSSTPAGDCTIPFTTNINGGALNGVGITGGTGMGDWNNGLKQVTKGTATTSTTSSANFRLTLTVTSAVPTTCGAGATSTVTGKFSLW